jgi:hypothetical protein
VRVIIKIIIIEIKIDLIINNLEIKEITINLDKEIMKKEIL